MATVVIDWEEEPYIQTEKENQSYAKDQLKENKGDFLSRH